MKLKFICHEGFKLAEEICDRIQGYLPNLVHEIEIIRTDVFTGILYTWEVLPRIERTVEPDWENDIIFTVIQGELYFADLKLFEAAYTLDQFTMGEDGTIRPFSERPRLGGQFLPKNMPEGLRGDAEYWAKVGVEEFLHYFGVPEQHDEDCFFHPKDYGEKLTMEDHRKAYCPKCREFMLQLEAPLNFNQLSARVEEIYGLRPKPKRRWEGILRGLLRQARERNH